LRIVQEKYRNRAGKSRNQAAKKDKNRGPEKKGKE